MACTIKRGDEEYRLKLDGGVTMTVTDDHDNEATVQYQPGRFIAHSPNDGRSVALRSPGEAVEEAIQLLREYRDQMTNDQAHEALAKFIEQCQ